MAKAATPTVDTEESGAAARALALKAALGAIGKKYGADTVVYLEKKALEPVEVIRTGSITLDLALGVGGIPKGRITEIFGENGSGKSSLCCHIVAECQATGGTAAFIDTEHALNPRYAKQMGVRLAEEENGLIFIQPMTGEEAFDLAIALIQSGGVDLVVIDSMAALVPKAELEGEMDHQSIGAQARLISKGLMKLTAIVEQTNTAVVFTNQTRVDIGQQSRYGPVMTTPGGRAPKFYSGVRIELKSTRSKTIKDPRDADRIIGRVVTATVVKSKVGPPFVQAEYDLYFPMPGVPAPGIDKVGGVLDAGEKLGLVQRSGAHYSFGAVKLGNGRDNARDYLRGNPATMESLAAAIYATTDITPIVHEVEPRPEES